MADEKKTNDKPEKAIEEKLITEHYEDLVSSYLDLLMLVPRNPYSEFVLEKKLARIEKELMPKTKENDELIKKEIKAKPKPRKKSPKELREAIVGK